jgi:hypothetical protein
MNVRDTSPTYLLAITIFDSAKGWFEVAETKDKTAAKTAKTLDQV